MQNQDMSDRDDNEQILKNKDTVARRAWVNRALECVRRRLERGEEIPTAGEQAERPSLFVVRSSRER